ncbi:hypothetical protein [Dactylosporangium sp. NPDC048998]|uniref:hypothetical protein n=1 Tax=Dactylosporangium sp. NPDC048998 TaxID=3363976 RepID=UPI00371EB6C4
MALNPFSNIIQADTEKLDGATFYAYGRELQLVIDELKSEFAACWPIADEIRDQSDRTIIDAVDNQMKYIDFLLSELRDLSHGDADQVKFLSDMLNNVEEINREYADFNGTHSEDFHGTGSKH